MNNKILADLQFSAILSESMAQTQTGADLLNKYKSFLMAHESTCGLVNGFLKEAQMCLYDNGVNRVVEQISDYINTNKTIWALASACESINSNRSSYNYINRNAARQVEKLLEMQEDDVVKYIKAGALKNVMFCESFRNIAKLVFNNEPMVESHVDHTLIHPVSMIENVGDGLCFEVCGKLYKMDDDKNIQETQWNEVSNTFKTISSLLESNYTLIDNDVISVKVGKYTYEVSEAEKITKINGNTKQEFTVEQLRDNNRLMLAVANPRFKNQQAGLLESIALLAENYNQIANLDNVAIIESKNDKFLVIESNNNLYATLLQSNHSSKWTINENAVNTLSFIKSKTNVSLSESYKSNVEACVENASKKDQENLEKEIKEQHISDIRDRIEMLTEKFKNDPTKLAVLSVAAQELAKLQ